MSEIKHCETCRIYEKTQGVCRLSGIPMNAERDYCSKHIEEFTLCDICHQPMISLGYLEVDSNEEVHQYCDRCSKLMHTCQYCPKAQYCAFEMDPNPMPKMVMQTIQQGNMTMQAQIRNPEREKLLCHSCECWNDETGCFRMYNIGCNKKPNFWSSRKS